MALAKRYDINPKTVAKWRGRQSVEDCRTGPVNPRSSVLSIEEEAIIVAFRRHTLLPLDDCLYALQATIPHLTRSTLITSNLPFEEWTDTFGTERLTGALRDRLTHHVNILEMNGESYRLNQSRAKRLAP